MAEDVSRPRVGRIRARRLTHSFRGGVMIASSALVLLLSTFCISSPTVPRILSI